jgi:hypothetical protein
VKIARRPTVSRQAGRAQRSTQDRESGPDLFRCHIDEAKLPAAGHDQNAPVVRQPDRPQRPLASPSGSNPLAFRRRL